MHDLAAFFAAFLATVRPAYQRAVLALLHTVHVARHARSTWRLHGPGSQQRRAPTAKVEKQRLPSRATRASAAAQ